MLYKRSVLKNVSKFTDKHKKQSSGGVLSKDVLKNFAKFTEKHCCRSLFLNNVAGWKSNSVRRSHWRCLKKLFHGVSLCWSLFLIRLQFWGPVTLLKKIPTQVPSCEICKTFKNNYFEEILFKSIYFVEHLREAGSEIPVRGSLFNKVGSLTAWRSLTV